jgi:U3 small nucleolar RNA-associated protein 3
LSKALVQTSTALNLAMYLLLKCLNSDQDPEVMQSHPIISRLQKLNAYGEKLEGVEDKVDGLRGQLENLVKAAALMTGANDDDSSSEEESEHDSAEVKEMAEVEGQLAESEEEEEESSDKDKEAVSRNVLNEARFGLRPNEIAQEDKKRRRPKAISDFGDEVVEDDASRSRALASTLNSIEQRSATRQRRAAPLVEAIDEHEEDDGELRRGLDMMEEELGKTSSNNDKPSNNDGEEQFDNELEEEDAFYDRVAKKSKSRKDARKELYAVAPKFPRAEHVVQGERAVGKVILNNRGLVPHKSKLNRNPRVKKREQYRKALIRRKGTIREVRTDEGHKYGGEETGIKSNLSRSRKLGK